MNSSMNQIIILCTISNVYTFSFSSVVLEIFLVFKLNLKYKVSRVSHYIRHFQAPEYVLICKLYVLSVNLHFLVL